MGQNIENAATEALGAEPVKRFRDALERELAACLARDKEEGRLNANGLRTTVKLAFWRTLRRQPEPVQSFYEEYYGSSPSP